MVQLEFWNLNIVECAYRKLWGENSALLDDFSYCCRNYRHYHYGDNLSSDTSSAYSGSDTMHSLQSAQEELDLSGSFFSILVFFIWGIISRYV
jgi:hypothetical protein